MHRTVLWIDDSRTEHDSATRMLSQVAGVNLLHAFSSREAEALLVERDVQCVVTDILRRDAVGRPSNDDGYRFVHEWLRPRYQTLPVLFHTKNLPSSFSLDGASQYLSKWDDESKKTIELETRLTELVGLYEAFADQAIWQKIEPRLVVVQKDLLGRLQRYSDVWQLDPTQFEKLVAELLDDVGFDVLWIPGGNDQGIDIVAGSRDADLRYLIDVKRYSPQNAVQVELVRHVYGVASAVQQSRPESQWRGGIITSSRFTGPASNFRNSVRSRPLLRDHTWLKHALEKYVPISGAA